MSAQHTPGPWFATKDSAYNEVARIGRAWNISTELALSHFGDIDADARLIAAAPELLEALQMAVRQNSHDMQLTGEELRQCEAAIAKATGGDA